jgi:hypothetical protein
MPYMYLRIYGVFLTSHMYLTRCNHMQSREPVRDNENRVLSHLPTGLYAASGSTQIYQNTSKSRLIPLPIRKEILLVDGFSS